jgi:hypothetical protein
MVEIMNEQSTSFSAAADSVMPACANRRDEWISRNAKMGTAKNVPANANVGDWLGAGCPDDCPEKSSSGAGRTPEGLFGKGLTPRLSASSRLASRGTSLMASHRSKWNTPNDGRVPRAVMHALIPGFATFSVL